jgi:UDP-2-acetamido-2,6-beta-L-arabino-hexul-4-ose reductase
MAADAPVAITGAAGFIGRNLVVRLREAGHEVLPITRATAYREAHAMLGEAGTVFHLAGANRPADPAQFWSDNRGYARSVAEAIAAGGRRPLVVVGSSIRAEEDSEFGRSKRAGERVMLRLAEQGGATVALYRLPNVFGKWARPNYNSAVATFSHNAARGLPLRIDDPNAPLALLHVDDLIEQWLRLVADPPADSGMIAPERVHRSTVGAVAALIEGFADDRRAGRVGEVGQGFERALYATFVAALPPEAISYPLTVHADPRGSFVEMLKTPASGQLSVLTAVPGATRGGHYHHAKVEKFVVVHGRARFRFRCLLDGTRREIDVSAERPMVVETIPGWVHDIANIGDDLLVAVIWANETFDPARPDTIAAAP